MTELINRPEYLTQLIQNKDVDLVKIVIAAVISISIKKAVNLYENI